MDAFAAQIGARLQEENGWLDTLEEMLPARFPPSYRSLISCYEFAAFDWISPKWGEVFLFGNGPDAVDEYGNHDLRFRIFNDEGILEELNKGGFLRIGWPYEGNYDPICFDARNRNGELPIVQIDHEEILCHYRIRVVQQIAPSFLELIKEGEARREN